MPPKRSAKGPRAYGRQAAGKTIKSVSLQSDIVAWAEQQAAEAGMTFSEFVSDALREAQTSIRITEPAAEYGKKKPKA